MEDQYCRLCMSEDDLTEMDSPILDCVQKVFSIVIHNDELSKEICQTCKEFVTKIVTFNEKVNKVQKLLQKILKRKSNADIGVTNKVTDNSTVNKHLTVETARPVKISRKTDKTDSIVDSTGTNSNADIGVTNKVTDNSTVNKHLTVETARPVKISRKTDKTDAIADSTGTNSNADIGVTNKVTDNGTVNKHLTVETARPVKISRKTDETGAIADSTGTNVISKNNNELISKLIKSIDLDEVEKTAANMKHWNPDINFCTVCKRKILDLEQFTKHAKTNLHMFKSYVLEKTGDPYIFFNYSIGYTCSVCQKVFTSKTILAWHYRDDHNMPSNKNCLKPNTLILKNDKKNEDEKDHLPEIIVKDEPDSTNVNINPINKLKEYPCRICKRSFGFNESLQRHIKKHHKDVCVCIHCDFTTMSRSSLCQHLRKQHYNLTHEQRICSTCFTVCNSPTDLLTHRKVKHVSKILQVCSICTATFSSLTLLKKHEKDVHGTRVEVPKKMLMCRRCNRRFMSLLVLEKHQCTAVKFPCIKKCGKRFESFSLMERHSLKCTSGVTIYSCKKCNKTLKSLSSFRFHLQKCVLKISPAPSSKPTEPQISFVNEPEKKIEKPTTNKKTKTVQGKNAFRDTYKCVKCFQTLSSFMELEKHHETCTPNKKIKKRSKSKKKINKHMSSFACKKCRKTFDRIECFAQHSKVVHGKLVDTIDKKSLPGKATPPPSMDLNLTPMRCTEKASKPDSSTQMYSTTPSPQPAKINEINKQTPKKTDTKQNDIDRSTIRSDVPTSNRVSSTSSEKSNSRWDCAYKLKTPLHVSTSFNTPKMPDRNRYPEDTNNPSSSAHNLKTSVTKSGENSMYTPKPPRSQQVVNAPKKNDQITIIQNSQSICRICKNPGMHLFCNPCGRCFLKSQVQYLNHMKMKHS